MELSPRRVGEVIVVVPTGRIDHLNADDFRAALEPYLAQCTAEGPALLFDLSGLEYVSSAGLRVLMIAAKQTRPQGGRIAVAAPQPMVGEVLDISRFNLVFPVHATLAEGLHALGAA